MSRVPRNYYSANFFHVIVQGIKKEYIFCEEKYIKKYIDNLFKYKSRYNITIIAYCIMNNHAHLLLYCNDILNISGFMKSVNTSYALFYNKLQNRVGYVFRDRFVSEPINTKRYLLNCIAYIHNNPVKANIVSNLNDYLYSSYKDYINKTGIATEEVIKLVFDTSEDYIDTYIEIHKCKKIFKDLEKDYIDYELVIKKFIKKNNKSIEEILQNRGLLKELTQCLEEEAGLSIRKISEILNINRSRLRRLLK